MANKRSSDKGIIGKIRIIVGKRVLKSAFYFLNTL